MPSPTPSQPEHLVVRGLIEIDVDAYRIDKIVVGIPHKAAEIRLALIRITVCCVKQQEREIVAGRRRWFRCSRLAGAGGGTGVAVGGTAVGGGAGMFCATATLSTLVVRD